MQATIKTVRGKRIPQALRDLIDPPKQLFVYSSGSGGLPGAGDDPAQRPVAIVGTRRPTAYGRRVAGMLAARLASAGVPLVSGLAFGIDTCVHRAAVDVGGRTIAVLPGGVDRESISPQTNLRLADRIVAAGGALVSERPLGDSARKEYYLSRNRLISGMARAVVVVEAAKPSGSLVTAQHAADQNKDLWAVPGPIDSLASAGTNWLIHDAASTLDSIDAFLQHLDIRPEEPARAGGLLTEFTGAPLHVNELADRLERAIPDLETELTKLELRGLVRRQDDGAYVRA